MTRTTRCYVGHRESDGTLSVSVVGHDDSIRPLPHIVKHSPTGLECGYGGSGPADLALSILTHYLGSKEEALDLYQSFKWAVVAGLPQVGSWELTGAQIHSWLATQEEGTPA